MQTRKRAPSPSLPQELITEILLRLPPKSIGRFRCVSKPWRSLLSHPHFIKSHLTLHSIHNLPKLIMISSINHSLFTLTFNPYSNNRRRRSDAISRKLKNSQGKWVSLLGECHGLVLVSNCYNRLFLINPTTLELVQIPNFSLPFNRFVCGFGYDSSSDDYKIVRLSHYEQPGCKDIFVDVYSSKMKTWRRIKSSPYDLIIPSIRTFPGVFLNGAVHWLATENGIEGSPNVIISFNLSDEKFKEVPVLSSSDIFKFHPIKLLVLGGCLATVCDRVYSYRESYDHIDIWVMKQYGVQESWTKFSVNIPQDTDWYKPICQLRNEEIVLLKDGEQLVLHNLKEAASRSMMVSRMPDIFCNEIMNFSGSLVSPNF